MTLVASDLIGTKRTAFAVNRANVVSSLLTALRNFTLPDYAGDFNISPVLTKTAHAFSVGQPVYFDGTAWQLADNTTAAKAETLGLISRVVDTDNFVVLMSGRITGLTGLIAGTAYFVGATPGTLTATVPSSPTFHRYILFADSTTSGFVVQRPVFDLQSLAGPSSAPVDATYLVTSANATLTNETVVTAAGLALLDDADAAAQRATLGLGTAALVADAGLVHIAGTETITGPKTFTANPAISSAAPALEFVENDQVLPAGEWRIQLSGNSWAIQRNTALAGDYSSATAPLSITSTDIVTFSQPDETLLNANIAGEILNLDSGFCVI